MGIDDGIAGSLAVAVVAADTVTFGVAHSRVVLTVAGIVALASYAPWLASELLGPAMRAPFALAGAAMGIAHWATRSSRAR